MPRLVCPYCQQASIFQSNSLWLRGLWIDGNHRYVTLIMCPNADCQGVVTAASPYSDINTDFTAVSYLPNAAVKEPDALIPAAVRDDLFEALRCATVRANKAVATLCRRALQGACVDQGANPKKNLYEQIDEVIASNKVHASLKEWADAIRFIGNAGAHPGQDGLETVTDEEADDILAFTEQFMELTYVARERVKRRLAAKATPPAP